MKQFFKNEILVFLLVIVSLIYFSPSVNATMLNLYRIGNSINNDFSVTTTMLFRFSNPISHLNYELDFKIYELTASSDFDSVDCKKIDDFGKTKISCDFTGMTKEKNFLTLKFKTKEAIKRTAEGHQFDVNYNISLPVKEMFVAVSLPERGILIEEPANKSVFPKDGKISSTGKYITIYWEKKDLKPGNDLRFSVFYSMPESPVYLIVFLTAIVIIVMIGIAFYIKKISKSSKDIISILNNDEKMIVDILNNHNGNAFQKVLVRETDFSKAKVSRLVKALRERGIVKIEPVSGRENKIILKLK